jgi:hypothetical protein
MLTCTTAGPSDMKEKVVNDLHVPHARGGGHRSDISIWTWLIWAGQCLSACSFHGNKLQYKSIFWDVAPCSPIELHRLFGFEIKPNKEPVGRRRNPDPLFGPQFGGDMSLRNTDKILPEYTASHPSREYPSSLLPWKPQIQQQSQLVTKGTCDSNRLQYQSVLQSPYLPEETAFLYLLLLFYQYYAIDQSMESH